MRELFLPLTSHWKALSYLELFYWADGVFCPTCKGYKVSPHKTRFTRRWQCNDCKISFSVTKGTIFERSKLPLNIWFQLIDLICIKPSVKTSQLSQDLEINIHTCRRVVKLIRWALANNKLPFIQDMLKKTNVNFDNFIRIKGEILTPGYSAKHEELYKKLTLHGKV